MHGSPWSVHSQTFYILYKGHKKTQGIYRLPAQGLLGGGGLCSYLHSGGQTRSPITR